MSQTPQELAAECWKAMGFVNDRHDQLPVLTKFFARAMSESPSDHVVGGETGLLWGLNRIKEELDGGRIRNARTYVSCAIAEAQKVARPVTNDRFRDFCDQLISMYDFNKLEQSVCDEDIDLVEHIRAALAYLEASTPAEGWQPMETCPRNRSVILQCKWVHEPSQPYIAEGYLSWEGAWCLQSGKPFNAEITVPIYWQPMPEPAPMPAETNR